ncbi:MAG: hypothetical protein MUE99_02265 [Chitinophagaceae bacterium]|nr:hypothetical protein [Chitinophagaceae bacterium]
MRKNIFVIIFIIICSSSLAQKEGGKTIDITSSFKPELIPPKKIIPSPGPLTSSAGKTDLKYQIPAQQMNFRYSPSPLRPLAYNDTSKLQEDRGYIKAGFGNFSTPYLKAAINYGNGELTAGNLEAYYTSSKGKMPFQQFARYGLKTNAIFQLNENHSLQARGGYKGQDLKRYGFQPESLKPDEDSLKLRYNDLHLGATIENRKADETFGVYYKGILDAHFFSDNNQGNETALHYDLPLEKVLNENISLNIGLKGVLSSLNLKDTSYSNNLTMVRAGVKYKLNDQTIINAALIPSWNNGNFSLLPLAELESYLSGEGFAVQIGIEGNFIQNTWRTSAAFNPWITQPQILTHTRNTDIYGAIKGNFAGNWFFRLKGSYSIRRDVPLFVNDTIDGRTFQMVFEPDMNVAGVLGELGWQKDNKYSWTNRILIQSFGGLEVYEKAFGLLPLEFNSSFSAKWLDKLTTKADLFMFSAPWTQTKAGTEKGKAGIDLNLGGEFDLTNRVQLWLQFNNIFNNEYQRWNQYPVLGFQALGGVIFTF